MCSQILKTISNRTMTLRVANNSHAVFEILGGGAILFTKSPKSQARKCSWFRREGLLREGRLRRHKLHIPRADFSMKSQPSSIPLRFLSHSDPGGGAEWAPDCPSLNCVFGDFLHKQKATRRRHVPLREFKAAMGIGPYADPPPSFFCEHWSISIVISGRFLYNVYTQDPEYSKEVNLWRNT